MANLTESQIKAINFDGNNILVSASAGSGKTFVMVERIKKLILSGKTSIDRILAVTYTKLASEEMKAKIEKAIIEEINKGNEIFRKQLNLLPSASISTFHSFCSNLLKTYFYLVDLDSGFGVADEQQTSSLKQDAMNKMFDDLYSENNQEFRQLLDVFYINRKDSNLRELIFDLYEFAISEKDEKEFLLNSLDNFKEEKFNEYESYFFNDIKARLIKLNEILPERILMSQELGNQKYIDYFTSLITPFKELIACDNAYEMKEIAKEINAELKFQGKVTKLETVEARQQAKQFRDNFIFTLDKLFEVFYSDRQTLLSEFLYVKSYFEPLINLALKFEEYYKAEKRDENVIDYSDMEHKTYDLLTQNSQILMEIRDKYQYIFADEYQDVNGIQEAILSLISNKNTFMVGDVKQSIYAFRGCNPDIFSKKYDEYLKDNTKGEAISFNKNFRSAPQVLNAVNNIFSEIMTKSLGGVDYKNNLMQASELYGENKGEVTIHSIFKEKKSTKKDGLPIEEKDKVYSVLENLYTQKDEDFAEGNLITSIINEEINKEYFDIKTNSFKKINYSDIVILTRSTTRFATKLLTTLSKNNIPVSSEAKNSIVNYPEIQMLVNILKFIDNPNLDIPLATALKSPLCNLQEEELLKIKKYSSKGDTFCQAVNKYRQQNSDDLAVKLNNFYTYVDKLRLLSSIEGVYKTLNRIIYENGINLYLLASSLGQEKLKRVQCFIESTNKQDKVISIRQYLRNINSYLDNLSLSASSGDNTVKIMSMHSSKGLEFPVVILAGLNSKLNTQDEREQCLKTRNYGMSLQYYDVQTKTKRPTIQHYFIKEQMALNKIGEEERLFYVATTRAKYKMHVTTSASIGEERSIFNGNELKVTSLDNFLSYNDANTVEKNIEELTNFNSQSDVRKILISKDNEELTEEIYKNVNYKYPYEENTKLAVKRSVTSINTQEEQNFYQTSPLFGDSSLEKGTAYHRFLEVCNFKDINIDKELIDLFNQNLITSEQLKLLDKNKLLDIVSLPIFKELDSYEIYREQPFILSVSEKELKASENETNFLVQGIIDLLAVKNNEAIIIDYKFSTLANGEDLIKKYKKQLMLYKYAVTKVLKLNVTNCYLINVNSLNLIEIKDI